MTKIYRVQHVESGNAFFSSEEKAFEYAKKCLIDEFNNDPYDYFYDLDLDECIDQLKETGVVEDIVYIWVYYLDSCREI